MIKSFLPSATVFTSNGERIIQAIKCIEHRELGDWYIDLVAPLEYQSYLEKDYIIVVPTKEKGNQPFRINNPKITDKVDVRAYHIGFDTKNYAVELSTIINGNAQACLNTLSTNIDGTHPFTFTSSITTLKSFSVVDSSLYNALIQIADEYNGILDFDGWNITISSSIGSDNGVVLAYGKNIQESEINENWDLVVTKLKPIGNDGITLTPAWLTADVSYDRPYTKIMNFDTDDLSNLALVSQLYLDRYKVPRVNYKVKADVEQNVALGDAVVVNARQFTTTAEVLSYDYNPLINRVIQVEFGNFRPTLKQFFSDMVKDTEEKAVKRAQVKIDEVNGEIELKVDKDGVVSAINLSPELVKILASKIELEGVVTANTYFKINLDGSMEATAGQIGGMNISSNGFKVTRNIDWSGFTSVDETRLSGILAETISPTPEDLINYDLNFDGVLSIIDLVLMGRVINGIDPAIFSIDFEINSSDQLKFLAFKRSYESGERTFINDSIVKTNEVLAHTVESEQIITESMFLGGSPIIEKGVFTPAIIGETTAGTGTYTNTDGRYTKIGDLVQFYIRLVWTAHTGTGPMIITGLPFTSADNQLPVPCTIVSSALTYAGQLACLVQPNSTQLRLHTNASNTALGNLAMDTTGTIYITGTYRI